MTEMKYAALVASAILLVVLGIGEYYMAYSPMKYRQYWQKGRGVSISIQIGIAVWALFVLPMMYFVSLSIHPNNDEWRGFIMLIFGTCTLEGALILHLGNRFVDVKPRRYLELCALAMMSGGMGLFLSGFIWLLGWPRSRFLEVSFLCVSYALFALDEIQFLRANNWQILPTDPK